MLRVYKIVDQNNSQIFSSYIKEDCDKYIEKYSEMWKEYGRIIRRKLDLDKTRFRCVKCEDIAAVENEIQFNKLCKKCSRVSMMNK